MQNEFLYFLYVNTSPLGRNEVLWKCPLYCSVGVFGELSRPTGKAGRALSTRPKRRSSLSACRSVEKSLEKVLDTAGVVREAMLR